MELLNRVVRLREEPLYGLAGLVVAEHILEIEEFPSHLQREAHSPVPDPLRRAYLAVPVLLPGLPPPRRRSGDLIMISFGLLGVGYYLDMIGEVALVKDLIQGRFVLVEEGRGQVEEVRILIKGERG